MIILPNLGSGLVGYAVALCGGSTRNLKDKDEGGKFAGPVLEHSRHQVLKLWIASGVPGSCMLCRTLALIIA